MKNKTAILASSVILSLGAIITLAAAGDLWLLNGNLMYSTSTANFVGIGTSNPSQSLEVAGNIKATGSTFYLGSSDAYLYADAANIVLDAPGSGNIYFAPGGIDGTRVDSSGNLRVGGPGQTSANAYVYGSVGIGTTTPSSILDVVKSNATTTITIGGSNSPACLKLMDSDRTGWTYCRVLDGAMSCSITSCE